MFINNSSPILFRFPAIFSNINGSLPWKELWTETWTKIILGLFIIHDQIPWTSNVLHNGFSQISWNNQTRHFHLNYDTNNFSNKLGHSQCKTHQNLKDTWGIINRASATRWSDIYSPTVDCYLLSWDKRPCCTANICKCGQKSTIMFFLLNNHIHSTCERILNSKCK